MPLDSIEGLLKRRIGLHSDTIGSSTVAQAVEQRMRACDMSSMDDYLQVLQHSPTEMDALIDGVIIPETWFYRDRNPFNAFSAWVQEQWLPRNGLATLRILSVPCSTGEEPYTLAMCLADLDIPPAGAHIDGVDISRRNIELALRAHYSDNSFRGGDLGFRDRYFVREHSGYRLKDEIRTSVNFARANLLDDEFVHQRQPYHVIFCRNLLIYFDRPTQNRAIDRLEQLLAPEAVLFLGHSETALLLKRGFTPLSHARCFGFRRTAEQPGESTPVAPARRAARPARKPVRKRSATPPAQPARDTPPRPAPAAPPAPPDDELLATAFRLADEGRLDEAAGHCQALLARNSHAADCHYLMGLIREADGDMKSAEKMLRNAVYLDPDHYEALTHLGVICQRNGDAGSARRFRQRAARVRQRRPEHGAAGA